MSTYAWVITKDNITEPGDALPSRVGWAGPHDATPEQVEKAKRGRAFRMLDDDGIDYYHGRIWTEDEPGSEADFGPLDDLGTPDAGAVVIQYFEHGRWVTL